MSMISAQIDELRELAGDGSMEWVSGPIRASVLRDAADTIWQLRDDLQRANAAVQDAEHDESRAWDRVRKAEAENAKLRELARWAARILTGIFPYVDYSRCTALEAVAAWKVEASKLGIEVDDA